MALTQSLLQLCSLPREVARVNEKGRVERSIRNISDNFFAARIYAEVADLNAEAKVWTDEPAFDRS